MKPGVYIYLETAHLYIVTTEGTMESLITQCNYAFKNKFEQGAKDMVLFPKLDLFEYLGEL